MNAMDDRYEFRVKDREGVEHVYEGVYFDGTEGLELICRVRALAAEPLGRALEKGIDPAIAFIGKHGNDVDVLALLKGVAKDVEWSAVARDLKAAFFEAGGHALLPKILSKTTRDGDRLNDEGTWARAYRRNWNEVFLAAWYVAEVNDMLGFTVSSTSESAEQKGAA